MSSHPVGKRRPRVAAVARPHQSPETTGAHMSHPIASPLSAHPLHPAGQPPPTVRPKRWGIPLRLGERRVLHPGRWRWLRALGWLVLLFFLTGAAFGLPAQAAVDLLPPENAALQLVGLLVAAATALGCYALAVRLGEGRGASELALRPALPGLAAGTALGLLLMSVLMGALVATGAYAITVVGATPAWSGLGLAVQAAVTEELWMRALLLRLLWRAFGPVPAFIVSALVFGALHLASPGATPLAGATVAMAGLMFCALYALTGRLWVPLGLHFAWNFTQGYVFGADVSGNTLGGSLLLSTAHPDAPAWLTGGTFGPEASVLALTLVTLVTVGALLTARKAGRLAVSTAPPPRHRPVHDAASSCDERSGGAY
jgi:membrane protease YdiL (CAAX protease family)